MHPYEKYRQAEHGKERAKQFTSKNEFARGGHVKHKKPSVNVNVIQAGDKDKGPPLPPPGALGLGAPPMPPPGMAPPGLPPRPPMKRGGAVKKKADGGGIGEKVYDASAPSSRGAPDAWKEQRRVGPFPMNARDSAPPIKTVYDADADNKKRGGPVKKLAGGRIKMTGGAEGGLGRLQMARAAKLNRRGG